MATKHVVDTHAFLWYLAGSAKLGKAAKSILQDPTSELVFPAIALAEALWIIESGRIPLSTGAIFSAIDNDPRITVRPLDRSIVERCCGLTAVSEMHDRQIVATALVLQDNGDKVDLLTKDGNISDSSLISVIW